MAKKRTIAYCLILLALLTMSCLVLSVGEAQARYINTVVWNTYVEPSEGETQQQFFTPDESLTVVLGEMDTLGEKDNAWYMVKFAVPGEAGTTGSLTWEQILAEGQEPALEVGMILGDENLDQEYPLTLEEESDTMLTMVLQNKIRRQEPETVYVRVTWTRIPGEDEEPEDAETMTAVFQVILPAEEKPEEESSEPIPEEEPAEEETTEAAVDETEETTADEAAPQARTNPEQPTEETTEESTGETSEEMTEETSEPEDEPDEEETTEPVTEEPTLPMQQIYMESLAWFDPAQPLPVWITVDSAAQVELGFAYYYDDVSGAEMWPLPRYTRLSTDGGKTWLLMYKEDTLILELEKGTTAMLMDLSKAQLDADVPRTLLATGWSESTAPGEASVGVTPMEAAYTTESRVMTANAPLKLALTDHWFLNTEDTPTDYNLSYSVERLVIQGSEEEGFRKAYEPVTLEETGAGEPTEGEDPTEGESVPTLTAELKSHNLILRVGSNPPPPGTYRINLEWKYKDICIAHEQMAFYINYLNDTDSAQTGGAEQ